MSYYIFEYVNQKKKKNFIKTPIFANVCTIVMCNNIPNRADPQIHVCAH